MGNEDYGLFSAIGLADVFKKAVFGLAVESGSSLVQKQNPAFFQQRPCNGYPLALAFGKTASVFSALGINSFRKIKDKARLRQGEGFFHCVLICL